jgi:hypothetical protein
VHGGRFLVVVNHGIMMFHCFVGIEFLYGCCLLKSLLMICH